MSEKKYVVPDGMLKAAMDAGDPSGLLFIHHRMALEAALRWLSENPQMPTMKQLSEMFEKVDTGSGGTYIPAYLKEWQRRMFLAPAPEVPEAPEEIKDLLCAGADTVKEAYFRPDIYNQRIIDAFRRGEKKGSGR